MPRTPEKILIEGQRRVASRTWLMMAGSVVTLMLVSFLTPENRAVVTVTFFAPIIAVLVAGRWMLETGRVRLLGWLLSSTFWLSASTAVILVGGLRANAAMTFLVSVMLSAAMLGRSAANLFSCASLVFVGIVAVLEAQGLMPAPVAPTRSAMNSFMSVAVPLGLSTYLLHLSLELRQRALDAAAEQELERERAQADLVQAQKLDIVGRLSGGIAHDFNNILTVILSASDLLRIKGVSDEELLDDIDRSVRRAGLLTNRLLAFSAPNAILAQDVELAQALEDFRPLLQRLVGDEVQLETGPLERLSVHVDRVALEQILLNLAVNAKQAIEGPGIIDFSVHREGDLAVLTVEDSGVGIPDERKSEVFEPFFSTKEHGTGLGLATVKQLVDLSGGSVSVSDAERGGAKFTLRWPIVAGSSQVSKVAADESGSFRKRPSVLLVEDNEAVRRAAMTVMRARGWKVRAAGDGLEALSILEVGDEYDIVVTDNAMRGIKGIELVSRLRNSGDTTPVLIVSGNPVEGELPDGVAFLPKPYGEPALVRAVKALIKP